jgi:hypothetical protein
VASEVTGYGLDQDSVSIRISKNSAIRSRPALGPTSLLSSKIQGKVPVLN